MPGEKRAKRQALVFILDGLGDLPCPQLDHKTPLEAAVTPYLDGLLYRGIYGLVNPVVGTASPDTHTGTSLLFGVSGERVAGMQRGPIEAAGAGLRLGAGDVVIRCNFATVKNLDNGDKRLLITDRRAGRISMPQTTELSKVLQNIDLGKGIIGSLLPATQHRAVLHLTGPDLSSQISDSDPRSGDPLLVQTVVPLTGDDPDAGRTAEAINRFTQIAHERLKEHPINKERKKQGKVPANAIICRGAGMMSDVETILHKTETKTAVVTGSCTIAGLGEMLGYHVVTSPTFTALADTDITGKIRTGLQLLAMYDLIFIHFKAPDICAHDRDPLAKKKFIERFDKALCDNLDRDDLVVAVTADHTTDSNTGEHTDKPVPSLLYTPDGPNFSCPHFGEKECVRFGFGTIPAEQFLQLILTGMGYMGFPHLLSFQSH